MEENGGMTGKRCKKNEGKSLKTGRKWRAIVFETGGVYCVE